MATAVKVAYSSQQKSDENHFYQKFYSHFQNSASFLTCSPTHLFSMNCSDYCFDNYFENHQITESLFTIQTLRLQSLLLA